MKTREEHKLYMREWRAKRRARMCQCGGCKVCRKAFMKKHKPGPQPDPLSLSELKRIGANREARFAWMRARMALRGQE